MSAVKIYLSRGGRVRGTLPVGDKCLAINFDALIQAHKFQLAKQGQRERTTGGEGEELGKEKDADPS